MSENSHKYIKIFEVEIECDDFSFKGSLIPIIGFLGRKLWPSSPVFRPFFFDISGSRLQYYIDKTRKEQLEYKILKDKLEEKIKNKKEGEKYLIFRGQIVLESDIPAIKRKMKEEAGTGWASKAPVGGVPQGQAQGQGAEGKSDQVGAPPRH